jgi:hypothetical protein
MPRKSPHPAAPEALPAVPVIEPRGVYTMQTARAALQLAKGTLSREIRLGRLRVSARGGRRYILGAWLLEWIASGELRPRTPGEANGRAAGAAANGSG